jgi:hypothetical protein
MIKAETTVLSTVNDFYTELIIFWYLQWQQSAVEEWFSRYSTSQRVASSVPGESLVFFSWPNPSSRTMTLESTQPLKERSTINLLGIKSNRRVTLTISPPFVSLLAFVWRYRDSFSLSLTSQCLYDLRFSRWWLWRMPSSGMLRRVALVRTDVSEKRSASIIKVTRIGELGTTLAVTSKLRRNTMY